MNVSGKRHIIFELEFLAMWSALYAWRDQLVCSPLVIFTHNDAVRDSLIACQTSRSYAAVILETCLRLEFSLALNMWIARVPTDSNIADDPSRDIVEHLLKLGAQRDTLNFEEMWRKRCNLNEWSRLEI